MRSHRGRGLLAVVVALALAGACGDSGATTEAPSEVEGTVTVYAAQSLASAFTDVAQGFRAAHPGVEVTFNFAGSATLVTQLTQGAPADVFASADQTNMQRVVDADLVDGEPEVFARNALHLVVAKGNPKGIEALAVLQRPDVTTVLCAENVPCGAYARQALDKAGVEVTPASNESSVAGVIGRVQAGEADAGIVYVTDVLANDEVSGVSIPDEHNVVAEYPHAALQDAPNPVAAEAFLAYVTSSAGQRILAEHGFLPL